DAKLLFVFDDDARLVGAAAGNGFASRRSASEDLVLMLFEPEEEVLVVDEAVFDDFGIAGGELAARQRIERREVGQHQPGLMEGPDQVLAMRGIDTGLAADR